VSQIEVKANLKAVNKYTLIYKDQKEKIKNIPSEMIPTTSSEQISHGKS